MVFQRYSVLDKAPESISISFYETTNYSVFCVIWDVFLGMFSSPEERFQIQPQIKSVNTMRDMLLLAISQSVNTHEAKVITPISADRGSLVT